MNRQQITTWALTLIATAMGTGVLTNMPRPVKAEQTVQFLCRTTYDQEENKRLPTTVAWTPRGKIAVIRWFKQLGNYSPEKRCQEISPRFQQAYNNGSLSFITNGEWNRQPAICTAQKYGGECDTLLMTLRPEDDSLRMVIDLAAILNGAQIGAIKHSSAVPQIYYRVDINEFLRTAPVEKE